MRVFVVVGVVDVIEVVQGMKSQGGPWGTPLVGRMPYLVWLKSRSWSLSPFRGCGGASWCGHPGRWSPDCVQFLCCLWVVLNRLQQGLSHHAVRFLSCAGSSTASCVGDPVYCSHQKGHTEQDPFLRHAGIVAGWSGDQHEVTQGVWPFTQLKSELCFCSTSD